MKWLALFAFAAVLGIGCSRNSVAPVSLAGKWVLLPETNGLNDTLLFYSENDSTFFFDKSVYYQVNMAAWTNDNAFRYNYIISANGTDSLESHCMSRADGQWLNIFFKQLSPTELEIGNFRNNGLPADIYTFKKVE